MNWIKIIGIMILLGIVYYLFMLIRRGKGLEVFAALFGLGLIIMIWTFIQYVRENKIG